MKKFFTYLVVAGLFAVALFWVLSQKPKQAIEDTKPAHSVTAKQLAAEFYQDEAAANEKYLNKIVAVSGEVKEVEKGERGKTSVWLAAGEPVSGVRCILDERQQSRTEFRAGEKTQFKCVCAGYLGHIEMVQCIEW